MSRHLSTRNISSKSMHAFLSNLANRQTDRQTQAKTFTSSFVGGNNTAATITTTTMMITIMISTTTTTTNTATTTMMMMTTYTLEFCLNNQLYVL